MTPDQWKNSIDLGTIATAMLAIAITYLFLTVRGTKKVSKDRRKK